MKIVWERGDFDGIFTKAEYRQKRSELLRAAWERGVFGEEWCRRQSNAIKKAWERGAYDEGCLQKRSEAIKLAWEKGTFDGIFQSPTSIEIQVAAALDIMGIEHQSQYRPDGYRCVYDELVLPDVLIEIHGDYWHGDGFPEQQERDAEKAQWAEENGYKLITIWEHEINKFGAWALIMERVAWIEEEET